MSFKVALIGLPGSGKGTQGQRLAVHLGVPHISIGEVTRELLKGDTELAARIRNYFAQSVEWRPLADDLAYEVMKTATRGLDGWVLDGFPRNLNQAMMLDAIDVVMYLRLSEEESFRRMLARARPDDTPEIIRRRFEVERARLDPLLGYCRSRWKVIEVDAVGSIDEVWQRILTEGKCDAADYI